MNHVSFDSNDHREIDAVVVGGQGGYRIAVNQRGNTWQDAWKITVTYVAGQGAYVPWFQIWRAGKVVREINSAFVESVEFL